MDILRDYHRMYWGGNADDEKQICKQTNVSMYPPIHQIVPTLFPNDLNASHDLTNAIPFGNVLHTYLPKFLDLLAKFHCYSLSFP